MFSIVPVKRQRGTCGARKRPFRYFSERSMSPAGSRHDGDLRSALFRPVGVEELATGRIDAFVRVSAEVIALALQKVRRQALGAVAVVVGECRHEGGCRD